MAIKTTPADKWFSKCVRERADYCCERCSNGYRNNPQGLDCSHHHGRGNWSIRFDPLNAEALCYGCHSHYGGTEERRKERLSEAEIDLLFEKKADTRLGKEYRRTKGRGAISAHYRAEYRRMVEEREQGKVTVDFVAYI